MRMTITTNKPSPAAIMPTTMPSTRLVFAGSRSVSGGAICGDGAAPWTGESEGAP